MLVPRNNAVNASEATRPGQFSYLKARCYIATSVSHPIRSRPLASSFLAAKASTKMAVVALLLVAMLVASTAPAADAFCFPDCYQRCANGQERNAACANMCVQACVVPTTLPDGTDLSKSVPGGK
ncbi:hypothetical protein GW17_00007460 [Ensete ventricosum]|nr:hypothetical protein GW17_00007460 [Ensete ventricosum]